MSIMPIVFILLEPGSDIEAVTNDDFNSKYNIIQEVATGPVLCP